MVTPHSEWTIKFDLDEFVVDVVLLPDLICKEEYVLYSRFMQVSDKFLEPKGEKTRT